MTVWGKELAHVHEHEMRHQRYYPVLRHLDIPLPCEQRAGPHWPAVRIARNLGRRHRDGVVRAYDQRSFHWHAHA